MVASYGKESPGTTAIYITSKSNEDFDAYVHKSGDTEPRSTASAL